jgi:tetratricopeptide (TPR) repeat protein
MRRTLHGRDAVRDDIANTLHSLGDAYYGLNEHASARDHLQQALVMQRTIHGQDAVRDDIANTLNNVGSANYGLQEHASARDHHQQALVMQRTIHGQDAVRDDIATMLNNLGNAYYGLKEHASARDHYQQSLVMRRTLHVLGCGGVRLLHDIDHNAFRIFQLQKAFGDVYASRVLYREALDMRLARLGNAHPEARTFMSDYFALPRPSSLANFPMFIDGLCCNLDCLQLKKGREMVLCSQCGDVRYCSTQCRTSDEAKHKKNMCVKVAGSKSGGGGK